MEGTEVQRSTGQTSRWSRRTVRKEKNAQAKAAAAQQRGNNEANTVAETARTRPAPASRNTAEDRHIAQSRQEQIKRQAQIKNERTRLDGINDALPKLEEKLPVLKKEEPSKESWGKWFLSSLKNIFNCIFCGFFGNNKGAIEDKEKSQKNAAPLSPPSSTASVTSSQSSSGLSSPSLNSIASTEPPSNPTLNSCPSSVSSLSSTSDAGSDNESVEQQSNYSPNHSTEKENVAKIKENIVKLKDTESSAKTLVQEAESFTQQPQIVKAREYNQKIHALSKDKTIVGRLKYFFGITTT